MNQNTALLIIDVQAGIIDGLPVYDAEGVLSRINLLIDKAKAADVPVIFIQHDGAQGHRVETNTAGWHIHPKVAPKQNEPVIHKRYCDSFFDTTLDQELRERKIQNLVITGCMTEYCVDTTCRRATAMEYDVTLASDAHTTGDTEHLRAAQIIAHHNDLLDGFCSGKNCVAVKPAAEIEFSA
jgi:nicotinamidase-related amidase